MKRRAALTSVGLALLELSCRPRSKSKPTPSASGSARAAPKAVARIGGSVTRGQSYFAELLVFHDGRVEVAISDPEGHALDEPADVHVDLTTRSRARATVPLRYSPRRQRFQGQAPRDVEVASGAAVVGLEHNGRRDEISIERAVVSFGPVRGGHMFCVGGFGAELIPEVSGVVRAFVRDANGEATTDPRRSFEAILLAQSLEKHRVVLSWDGASASYRGNATTSLRPGPMEFGTATARARIQQAGLLPSAQHGGQMLLVGFYAVEVLLRADEVELFVYDAFGKPYPAGHLELVVAFGARQPLLYRLGWDEKSFSYRAALQGRDVSAMPIGVSLTAGEHSEFGAAALR